VIFKIIKRITSHDKIQTHFRHDRSEKRKEKLSNRKTLFSVSFHSKFVIILKDNS